MSARIERFLLEQLALQLYQQEHPHGRWAALTEAQRVPWRKIAKRLIGEVAP